jgi:hypothetical protein
MVSIDALEGAVQSDSLPETALHRIFVAHRLMIELRAAQKLNAGLFEIENLLLLVSGRFPSGAGSFRCNLPPRAGGGAFLIVYSTAGVKVFRVLYFQI